MATVHEGKKQFNCSICGTNFSQKAGLKKHIAAVHEGKKPLNCSICDANFASKQKMNTQIASVHEESAQKC